MCAPYFLVSDEPWTEEAVQVVTRAWRKPPIADISQRYGVEIVWIVERLDWRTREWLLLVQGNPRRVRRAVVAFYCQTTTIKPQHR